MKRRNKLAVTALTTITALLLPLYSHAFDAVCENDLTTPNFHVSYSIHLDGASNWGWAVVSLKNGYPDPILPRASFKMPCQKESSGDFVCVSNTWNGYKYDQIVFRWHSSANNNWAEDDLSLTFNIASVSMRYTCHE